jgi:glutamate--cysteine ligase regulatory subunit
MNGGPSIIRRPTSEKSNTELINSLRANVQLSQEAAAADLNTNVSNSANGLKESEASPSKIPYTSWTTKQGNTIYIPSLNSSGLLEERSQYDITVKLFLLPSASNCTHCVHTEDAVSLVLRELNVPSIDLLIISFPGISFDADDDEDEALESDERETAFIDEMIETWRCLETLHEKGVVAQMGLSEFGSERLRKFLPKTKVRPSVDQINVRDCCVVPKSLILYAKQEKIELLTHNDCTNILPKGTIRELLGTGEHGAGILSEKGEDGGLTGEVEPQWVVKYTAVVKNRGVIENKGYFAMGEVNA